MRVAAVSGDEFWSFVQLPVEKIYQSEAMSKRSSLKSTCHDLAKRIPRTRSFANDRKRLEEKYDATTNRIEDRVALRRRDVPN